MYRCKANLTSSVPDIVKTQRLCKIAPQPGELDIVWRRGIMPYGHHKVPDPPCEAPTRFVGDQSGWAAGGTFFGDGSGGEDTADPVLRRAAWAVIKLHALISFFKGPPKLAAPLNADLWEVVGGWSSS